MVVKNKNAFAGLTAMAVGDKFIRNAAMNAALFKEWRRGLSAL